MSLFAELKRRNVFRVAIAYALVGWLVMQVGEVMAPALHLPEWVKSALAFFIILGFPFAVFFAWAFELTPDGLRREGEVARETSVTRRTGQKLNIAIIALLVLALGYFVADKYWLEDAAEAPGTAATQAPDGAGEAPPSIAVLPLADMSPQGDSEYFSDGLTEELLNILANISELRVAGRTSSFAFKGQNEDLRVIGEKLDVDHILEGSVRKDDARNRVRITLQLIDTNSGYHLWSETYDRDLDDIFAIQEDVAHQVATALRVTLLGADEQRLDQLATTDLDAYDLYLQATQELRKAGYTNLERAEDLFQQTLTIDSNYLPARLGLVATWASLAYTGAISGRQAFERGMPVLEQLLAAEPDNARAHALHGDFLAYGRQTDDQAARAYQRALELAPRDAATLADYGRFVYDRGGIAEGMELIDEAARIEPLDITILFAQCQARAQQRRFDDSVATCRRIQELAPDGPQGYYGVALAHLYMGDMAGTIKGYAEAIARDPEDYEMLAAMSTFWLALGDARQAEPWLERAEALGAGQPVPVFNRVRYLEFQEQYERAGDMAWQALGQKLENRHGSAFFLRQSNAAQAMRSGDWERGLAPYREHLPWAFEPELTVPSGFGNEADDLLVIARLLKSANPLAERTDELLRVAEDHIGDFHPGWGLFVPDFRRAAISALRNDTDATVDHLRKAQDLGLFVLWRTAIVNNPVFMPLLGDPGMQALLAEFEAEAERQRGEAYALLDLDQ